MTQSCSVMRSPLMEPKFAEPRRPAALFIRVYGEKKTTKLPIVNVMMTAQSQFWCFRIVPNINSIKYKRVNLPFFLEKGQTQKNPSFGSFNHGCTRIDTDKNLKRRKDKTRITRICTREDLPMREIRVWIFGLCGAPRLRYNGSRQKSCSGTNHFARSYGTEL